MSDRHDLPFRRPLGATPLGDRRTHVRVWAPNAGEVAVRVARRGDHPLTDEGYGTWAGEVPAGSGDDYWILLDGRRAARSVHALAAARAARPQPGVGPGRL